MNHVSKEFLAAIAIVGWVGTFLFFCLWRIFERRYNFFFELYLDEVKAGRGKKIVFPTWFGL